MASLRFPFLMVRVELGDRVFEENAVLDTGFDGEVAIPESRAEGLQPEGSDQFVFPDGTIVEAGRFRGVVQLGDLAPRLCRDNRPRY